MAAKTHTFFSDPGHGWLRITRDDVNASGIADKVSSYSYQRGRWVYLEEDCDAALYIDALREKGVSIVFRGRCANNRSSIRSFDRYRPN